MSKKNYVLLVVTVASILLISCSNDNGGSLNTPDTVELEGTWNLTDYKTLNVMVTDNDEDTSVTLPFQMIGNNYNLRIGFNELDNFTQSGSFSANLKIPKVEEEIDELPAIFPLGKWSRVGNALTLNFDNKKLVYSIKKVSRNKITLTADFDSYFRAMKSYFKDEEDLFSSLTFNGYFVLELTKSD